MNELLCFRLHPFPLGNGFLYFLLGNIELVFDIGYLLLSFFELVLLLLQLMLEQVYLILLLLEYLALRRRNGSWGHDFTLLFVIHQVKLNVLDLLGFFTRLRLQVGHLFCLFGFPKLLLPPLFLLG